MGKKVKNLRLNSSQNSVAAQLTPLHVKRKVFKNIEQSVGPNRMGSAS